MNIYIAGPFFSEKEKRDLQKMIEYVQESNPNADLFIPMDHVIDGGERMSNEQWGKEVFNMDVASLDQCDEVYVLYYGLYSDSGTAWETGYAAAKNKPITLYIPDDSIQLSSVMMHNSAKVVISNKVIEQK